MGAKNKIIAGDFENWKVDSTFGNVTIRSGFSITPLTERIIDKTTVESYEIVTEEKTKSSVSAIGRGALGVFLIGPFGLLAAASAKNKGVHAIALHFKDGKKSLLEIDDKIYKSLVKKMF